MSSPNSPCEVKTELLRDYATILERVKIARREHTETLAAGAGDDLALRSTQRIAAIIAAIKALCITVRARYTGHCHVHRCSQPSG